MSEQKQKNALEDTPTETLDANASEKEKQSNEKSKRVKRLTEDLVLIDETTYQLVVNYRGGLDIEQLESRYSDVLNRYEFIVGDIGFGQLRLKGFFGAEQKRVPADQKITALDDYLYEFCNFGCAYFVLERVSPNVIKEKEFSRNKKNNRSQNNKQSAHIVEKKKKIGNPSAKNKPVIRNKRENTGKNFPGNKKELQKTNTQGQTSESKIAGEKKEPQSNRNFTIRKKDGPTT